MIEIIPDTDIVNKYTKNAPITNDNIETHSGRARKRCFKCGNYQGQWCEIFEHGKWRHHFLCKECKLTNELRIE